MIIKARCNTHPGAAVLFLEGTTSFRDRDDNAVTEQSERATQVALDEHNLYCTGETKEHDIVFEVTSVDGHWLADGN